MDHLIGRIVCVNNNTFSGHGHVLHHINGSNPAKYNVQILSDLGKTLPEIIVSGSDLDVHNTHNDRNLIELEPQNLSNNMMPFGTIYNDGKVVVVNEHCSVFSTRTEIDSDYLYYPKCIIPIAMFIEISTINNRISVYSDMKFKGGVDCSKGNVTFRRS